MWVVLLDFSSVGFKQPVLWALIKALNTFTNSKLPKPIQLMPNKGTSLSESPTTLSPSRLSLIPAILTIESLSGQKVGVYHYLLIPLIIKRQKGSQKMSETFSIYTTSRIYQEYKKRQAAGSKPKRYQPTILQEGKDDSYSQNQSVKPNKKPKYNWTAVQNKRYVKFLMESGSLFDLSRAERKQKKVNLQMSRKVKTRTPTQCHTHHQKMMTRHGDIDGIISHFGDLFQDSQMEGEWKPKERQPDSKNEKQTEKEDIKLKSPTQLLAIDSLIEPSNMIFLEKDGEEYEYSVYQDHQDLDQWISW